MKRLIIAITAGAALVGGSSSLDGLTTEDLEASTQEFIKELKHPTRPNSRRKTQVRYSTRSERLHGGGKSGKGNKGSGSRSGPSGGKGGKNGWGGDDDDDDRSPPGSEMFHMLPVACPGQCVSSYTNKNFEMTNSLSRCNGPFDNSQWWTVHSDGSYVMLESLDTALCVSVDFEHGDSPGMLLQACNNGIVTLRECGMDHGTQWYFSGGQLISSLCWAAGVSSILTVFPDPDKNYKCDGAISVYGTTNDAILRSDTFMFVDRLPESPLDVDDVLMPTLSPSLSPTEEPKRRPKTLDYEGYNRK